jgi:hypothetical protein
MGQIRILIEVLKSLALQVSETAIRMMIFLNLAEKIEPWRAWLFVFGFLCGRVFCVSLQGGDFAQNIT